MMDVALPLEEVVSREIIRKLRLATEAENKEDREIVCEEVFCDVTGRLDDAARERLGVTGDASFYQVLAPYYLQDTNSADAVLYFCKRLWGQSIVGAIFALLLHRWLLLRPEAGGLEQRQKHVHVLMLGCRQLFLGDVQSGSRRFHPLFSFVAHEIALSPNRVPLDGLPAQARVEVLRVAAAYLPYYEDAESVRQLLDDFPSAAHTLAEGGHTPGEGTDFVVAEVTETIPRVRSEQGLLSYLRALIALGPTLRERGLGVTTKLRLQSELYSLASRGPPHYAPHDVRQAARQVLDALFPMGRRSRQLVRFAFWLLNPLSGLLLLPVRINTRIVGLVGSLLGWTLRALDRTLLRRAPPPPVRRR
ncbi:K-stimulated pyrophosphate-energized sodium pump protein [Raphidocelis subcapitata]|uniref:K-stimulated pyrophosphate-energized sodium pump protein n=1 Tax=Raphidocelis subcapitata TaxID=307507 RepID=A0A2V0NJG4_9CHLO|nr:K-stimulated pyrophosphate-energized sodium pump protein [Raphidocelis subcapitata]|eukprot:GBF87356.1 K-stimulated pyrophosphate-energized sodium pump protein [Raphidocelis subcapitata]